MKLYNTDLTFQNYGTAWFLVIRGSETDIEETFNALINFGGVSHRGTLNVALEYQNESHTLATCWSSEKKMRQFFAFQYWLRHSLPPNHKMTEAFVNKEIETLKQEINQVVFRSKSQINNDFYSIGKSTAERPDEDFKDAVLQHALKDKSELSDSIPVTMGAYTPGEPKFSNLHPFTYNKVLAKRGLPTIKLS